MARRSRSPPRASPTRRPFASWLIRRRGFGLRMEPCFGSGFEVAARLHEPVQDLLWIVRLQPEGFGFRFCLDVVAADALLLAPLLEVGAPLRQAGLLGGAVDRDLEA